MGDIAALRRPRERSEWPQTHTLQEYVGWLSALGYGFPFTTTMQRNEEPIAGDFAGLVSGAYAANSVVFACLLKRLQIFSQVRFQFQQLRAGQPGDLFGTADLGLIENPEPGHATSDLLSMAIIDADLAGDWFGVRRPGRLKRLRPDWTVIVVGSPNEGIDLPAWDPDAEVVGYVYTPGGPNSGGSPQAFGVDEIAHFVPIRNPLTQYRGMPLPTAALRDIRGDSSATTHKLAFFDNAATPNLVVKFPPTIGTAKAQEAIEVFEQEHSGAFNAYRTMYLLGGADATVVGKDLQQLDFAATVGKGETRIVAAMGLHPAIVPVSEGLQGSALNQGEAQAARRLVADTTLVHAWTSMAQTLETVVPPPGGSRMWFDIRHVPFLAEDVSDAAKVVGEQASAIRKLSDGGFVPDTAVDAVVSGDLRRLRHSGYLPVQVQPIQGASEGSGQAGEPQQPAAAAASVVPLPGYATRRPSLATLAVPRAPYGLVARRTFWASSGLFEGETVEQGSWVPADHELARAFPSMFEPSTTPFTAQPHQLPALAGHSNGKE